MAWWDTRDIQGLRGTDAYYAYSNDDGRTWSKNIRLTERSIDRKLGIWGDNYDIASQPGVASTNAYAVFGWDDTRNSDLSFQDSRTTGGGLHESTWPLPSSRPSEAARQRRPRSSSPAPSDCWSSGS